jgi:hypothetical protein
MKVKTYRYEPRQRGARLTHGLVQARANLVAVRPKPETKS